MESIVNSPSEHIDNNKLAIANESLPSEQSYHEALPNEVIEATQQKLAVQLLGEEEYKILTMPRIDMETGREAASPYALTESPEFSEASISKSAMELAAETLPKEIVHHMHLEHEIPDNISYQQPPTLETIHLMIDAWEQTDRSQEFINIIGKMTDFLSDRRIRDDINEALTNAADTGESFHTHYNFVSSRETAKESEIHVVQQHKLAHVALYDLGDLSYNPYSRKEEDHERLVQGTMASFPAQTEYEVKQQREKADERSKQLEEARRQALLEATQAA